VAYKLKLPDHAKIHPVFHVSQLKQFKGVSAEQYIPLPLTMSESGPIIHPIEILDARTIIRGTQKINQVLVQWDQLPAAEATWEDTDALQNNFPTFNLEDKVNFNGEGIVMKPNANNLLETTTAGARVPQNMRAKHSVRIGTESKEPRRGERTRAPNTMWKDFV
jgi:hypothetical protein